MSLKAISSEHGNYTAEGLGSILSHFILFPVLLETLNVFFLHYKIITCKIIPTHSYCKLVKTAMLHATAQ